MPMMSPLLPLGAVNVAILGGGFDPITLGHENIAQLVHKETGFLVLIMPCYQHLFGKELASPKHRLDMTRIVTSQYVWAETFDFEIRNKSAGSMYETMQSLRIQYPKTTFHLIMGTDNANVIEKWDRGLQLIAETPCIVIKRPNYQPNVDWFLKGHHQYIEQELETSSTSIRNAIENGEFDEAKKDCNPKVWNYITTHGLYGFEENDNGSIQDS